MSSVRVLVAMALMLVVCESAYGDNLIVNPGFETGDISPWQEVVIDDDENPPTHPQWMAMSWGAPEGMFFASGYNGQTAMVQGFEPVLADDITELTFLVRQQGMLESEPYVGLVCWFEDPFGEMPYTQSIAQISSDGEEWVLHDGLADMLAMAGTIEGVGPEGPRLMGLGLIGSQDATTFTDDWHVAVPEPSSLCLLAMGVLGLCRRR